MNDKVPYKLLYNINQNKLFILRKTIMDLINKGLIKLSSSSTIVPVLFIKKLKGSLRLYVDY